MADRTTGLRSGELARATGVSTDSLRHYERRGLLAPPRRLASGYRAYPEKAVERVRLIQNALSIGFTLDELSKFLRDRAAGRAPCRTVRAVAGRKLAEVERQIEELARFRDDLRRTLAEWEERIANRAGDEPLRLLESLAPRDRAAAAAVSEVRFSRRPGRPRRKE
jgi:DNA-binding transcriptional MerR regulator